MAALSEVAEPLIAIIFLISSKRFKHPRRQMVRFLIACLQKQTAADNGRKHRNLIEKPHEQMTSSPCA